VFPVFIFGVALFFLQYLLEYFQSVQKISRLEDIFPSFVEDLVSALKSGIPMHKAIITIGKNDYGELNPYIRKLANQVEWNISLDDALRTFARETKSNIIKRAIETVMEAESYGGNIGTVLSSVTDSLINIKEIKKKREATIHAQIIQNYIIFMVFLAVIIVIQNFVVPFMALYESTTGIASEIVQTGLRELQVSVSIDFSSALGFISSIIAWLQSLNGLFIMLVVIQGFLAGLVIGKLSTGNIRAGLKHSAILAILGLLVITIAQAI